MQIEVMLTGRWRGHQRAKDALAYQAGIIMRHISELHEHERLQIIQHPLIMRPLNNRPMKFRTFGLLTWRPSEGYRIAFNIDLCMSLPDIGALVATHETAHLICAVLHGYWGHGPQWKERYYRMEAWLNDNVVPLKKEK